MKKILIVDDDAVIGNMIEEMLKKKGYEVMRAYSGTEALMVLAQSKPDLVLLDLMLPGMSGEEVLAQINGIPVIAISGKTNVDDKVSVLLGGAVDYITKPFHLRELAARIEAHLRGTVAKNELKDEEQLFFEDIILDLGKCSVTVMGHEVDLTRTEYAILKQLMQSPKRVVTKLQLLDNIMEDTPDCTENSLKVHVSHLRLKLRKESEKDYIESVWGIGFKMKENAGDTSCSSGTI